MPGPGAATSLGRVREFWIYTLLRLLLFVAVFAIVLGIWIAAFGKDSSLFAPLLISVIVSGVISAFALNRQRSALAARVEHRARAASEKFEERRATEDEA